MPQLKEPRAWLTWEGVEAAGLRAQGWSISATARHLGRDREATCLDGIASPGSADHRAGYELDLG
jgi:hypothetical protein